MPNIDAKKIEDVRELCAKTNNTLQAMASLASVPMDLWDRHSNAVLELIALARSLSSRVEAAERENETQVIESIAVRDKFIIERDLWLEFVNQLPDKRPSLDSTVAAAIEAAALTAERRAKEEAGLDRRAEELREDARLGAALARAEAAETRSAELARALTPFAHAAEYLEAETEGFVDDDPLTLTYRSEEACATDIGTVLQFGDFRRARTALGLPMRDDLNKYEYQILWD